MNIFSLISDDRNGKPFAVVVQRNNAISAIGISEKGKTWAQSASRKYKTISEVISAIDVNFSVSESRELTDTGLVDVEHLIPQEVAERLKGMFDNSQTFAPPIQKKSEYANISDAPIYPMGTNRAAALNYKAMAFRNDMMFSSVAIDYKAGRIGRTRSRMQGFDPNAVDADNDGRVQDNTPFERPATPNFRMPQGMPKAPKDMTDDEIEAELEAIRKNPRKKPDGYTPIDGRGLLPSRQSMLEREAMSRSLRRAAGLDGPQRQSRTTTKPNAGTPPNPNTPQKPGLQRRVGRRIRKMGTSIEDRGKERDKRRLQRRVNAQQGAGVPNVPNAPSAPNGARVPRGARRGRRGGTSVGPVTRTGTGVPTPPAKPGKTPVGRTILKKPTPPVPKRSKRGTTPKKKIRERILDRLDTFADDITTPGAVTARRKARRTAKRTARGTAPSKASGAAAKPRRRGVLETLEDFAENISTPGKVTAERRRRRDARRAAKGKAPKGGRAGRRTGVVSKTTITQRRTPGKKVYGQKTNWASLSDAQKKAVKKEAIKRLAELEATWQRRLGKGPDDDVLESEIQEYIDEQIKKGASKARIGVLNADYNDAVNLAEMEVKDDFSNLDIIGPTRRKAILDDAKATAKPRPTPKPKPKKPKPATPTTPSKPKPTTPKKPKPATPSKPKPTTPKKPKPTTPKKPKPATPKKPKPTTPKTPKPPTPSTPKPPRPPKTPSTPSPSMTGSKINGVNMPTYDEVTKMTKVTGPVGSNGGQWYQDPTTGRKFLLKPAQSADHAQNEAAIAAAYRAAGIDVPNLSTVSDGKGKSFIVSEFLASSPWNGQQSEAKKGMGIDMLTSNWDAFGAGGQNIVVDVNGAVYRIDYGGGGKYRATGPVKPEFDATQPWKDPSTMITGAFGQQMYGNVTNEDIANAMESIADLDLTEVEKQMIDAGVTDAALRKQILDVFAVRQKEAAKLRDDFRKYDPAATPLTGTGKQIAPGGKIATGTSTARKRKGVKKKSTINPSSRARPTRSRAITTVTKLVESNRNGSIFGDSDTDPVVDAAAVSALAKVAAARRAPGGLTTEKMMEHAYDMHGFSDPPVLATPQEIEKLIDQGWTVLVRGVGTYDNGVDPTNPKQTKNQKQVWGYLAGRRFISGAGTNGNQNMYGPGDYFATPHDAKYSWDNFHSKTPMLNGLENNSSMLVLVPPAGRIIKTTDLDTMRFQWTSTFQQINAINNPKYGSNPNATVAQIRKTLPQAALDNPIAKVYLGLLEAKEKARGNAAKQEADDAITAFSAYVGGHASFTALLLGYDGVEHAGSSGVTTFFNRSGMVALGEATNLTKISNLIKKTQRGKTDPKLRM